VRPGRGKKSKASKRAIDRPSRGRKKLPLDTKLILLTESGYRCAVPTCRAFLTLDIHHLEQVSDGGSGDPANLLAVCPTCHARYHRGDISQESLYVYKTMLVALTGAFDVETVDKLLFLEQLEKDFLIVSGDGVLPFARLIASGLASVELKANNGWQIVTYSVSLSDKGHHLLHAWKGGDRLGLYDAVYGASSGGSISA
jgi:hypothetical protein